MKRMFFLFVFFSFFDRAMATGNPKIKRFVYIMNLVTTDGNNITGYLNTIDDSSIFLTSFKESYGNTVQATNSRQINYKTISKVKIYRRGRIGKGILLGAIGGAATGAIAGLATYEGCGPADGNFCFDFGPGFNALQGAILGIVPGMLIGALSGALSKKTFIINGQKEEFEIMRSAVLKKVMMKTKQVNGSK